MVKIILDSELDILASKVDDITMERLRVNQINKFESYEDENLISFDWYDLQNIMAEPGRITIYHSKIYLFFICETDECLKLVNRLVKTEGSNEKIIFNFFNGLIKDDIKYIEDLEEEITNTEDELLTISNKECSADIIGFRRELLKLKRYYEQLNQIFEELTENQNGLIAHENLRYFRILDNKIDRLFSHVLNLRDYVTQVREAYQAQIDIEQNSLMKVFTVVTAVFLPLTLIVGWYGMNLKMPEFEFEYGYPMVIAISVVVLILSLIFFKKKKWF